jgi:GH24 family phage-related lysozyme (muramidase)
MPLNPPMKHSQQGLDLTKRFEQCRQQAFIPMKGDVPTIGWGHTLGVHLGMYWIQEQCDQALIDDYSICEQHVNAHVNVSITQGEFDALCDFEYNLGCNALGGSTLLRLLNEGNVDGAIAEFQKWDHAGGHVVAGLLRRRLAEVEEFKS